MTMTITLRMNASRHEAGHDQLTAFIMMHSCAMDLPVFHVRNMNLAQAYNMGQYGYISSVNLSLPNGK